MSCAVQPGREGGQAEEEGSRGYLLQVQIFVWLFMQHMPQVNALEDEGWGLRG